MLNLLSTISTEDQLLAEASGEETSLACSDFTPDLSARQREMLYSALHRATFTPLQEACIRQWLDNVTQPQIARYLNIRQSVVSGHIAAGVKRLQAVINLEEMEGQTSARECYFETLQQIYASLYRKPSHGSAARTVERQRRASQRTDKTLTPSERRELKKKERAREAALLQEEGGAA